MNGRTLHSALEQFKAPEADGESFEAPDRAGVNSRTQCFGLMLEAKAGERLSTPQGQVQCITILYGAMEPEIVYTGSTISFVYRTMDGKRHEVTIRGNAELRKVYRMISIGKRESVRVTGDSVVAVGWREVN